MVMPEVLTKFPEVVLKVLKESGIECGTGAAQKILTNCPAERFCSLRSGELCVYGLEDINKMTQLSASEFAQYVSQSEPVFNISILLFVILAFSLGFLLGRSKKYIAKR